jgi:hypothetical protein
MSRHRTTRSNSITRSSKDRSMIRTRTIGTAVVVGALLLGSACSQKYSAERDGKKLGEAICDLRDADNAEDAQDALDDVNEQLDDLGNKFALYTAEDRADIDNNLADLAEHQVQDQPTLMQQDLAVLERSASNIRDDVNETSAAAWEGVLQGLSSCTQ